jgi:hypothetical protein
VRQTLLQMTNHQESIASTIRCVTARFTVGTLCGGAALLTAAAAVLLMQPRTMLHIPRLDCVCCLQLCFSARPTNCVGAASA